MNYYSKRTLQLIYSDYEDVRDSREDKLKGYNRIVFVPKTNRDVYALNGFKDFECEVLSIGSTDWKKKLLEYIDSNSTLVAFARSKNDYPETTVVSNNVVYNAIEKFFYRIDNYIKNASLFDVGSNGLGWALGFYDSEEACRIIFDNVNRLLSPRDDLEHTQISNIPDGVEYGSMYINNQKIELSFDSILDMTQNNIDRIMSSNACSIIPIGFSFSNVWRIVKLLKKRDARICLDLKQYGRCFDDLFIVTNYGR